MTRLRTALAVLILAVGFAATTHGQMIVRRVNTAISNYGTFGYLSFISDGVFRITDTAQTGFTRLQFGGGTASYPAIERSGSSLLMKLADGSGTTNVVASEIFPSGPQLTVGSATGLTVVNSGSLRRLVYTVTVDRTAFVCAAVTCDVTLGTVPAKSIIVGMYADLTTVFACSATCTTATLSGVIGRGAGGAEFLASADLDAALALFGDADAELGTQLVRAAAIQGGSLGSWSATTTVVLRVTSGTGNIGNGSVTNFSTGSITVYVITEKLG